MDKVMIFIIMIPFIIAGVCFVAAVLQFLNIGFPINTAYIFSPKIVREAMDKKPYFRQSAIALILIGCAFLFMGLDIMHQESGLYMLLLLASIAAIVIYLIVSNKRLR